MEPCPCHLQFFLCHLGHPRISSWLRAWLDWLDASNFGSMAYAHKPFTCIAGAEGEVPFQSPGFANMQPPGTSSGPLLRPSLRWSQRGQGHGAQAKRWCSKWASPKGMDEARKRCWAWSKRPCQSSSAVTLVLCSSHSVAMAFNSCSC